MRLPLPLRERAGVRGSRTKSVFETPRIPCFLRPLTLTLSHRGEREHRRAFLNRLPQTSMIILLEIGYTWIDG